MKGYDAVEGVSAEPCPLPYGLDHPLEKMLSVKGTRMLLLYVYEHPGCTKEDVREWIFDGVRRDRTFEAVIGYGAVAEDSDKKLWLTEKGEFFARLFAKMREAAEKDEYLDLRDVDELGSEGIDDGTPLAGPISNASDSVRRDSLDSGDKASADDE